MYVDVHAHLVHRRFATDADRVATRAAEAGLDYVIVNGLDPESNRATLELCERHGHLLPALGIYPVTACAAQIDRERWQHDWPAPEPFDVDAELDYIASKADEIVALGECGLDYHWVKRQVEWDEQERVLRRFCALAREHDKPLIVHTRKAEQRCFDVLREEGITRADFHCYGGKLKLARRIADAGYYLSIPPVVVKGQSFQRIVAELPADRLLTETDSPYMGPERGKRNEPANVPVAIDKMAEVRGITSAEMATTVAQNFRRLFRIGPETASYENKGLHA